jgi:integrase
MRLTKDAIERAKPPEPGKKERFIRDDTIRGLGVRITTACAKSFIFEARIKGRPRRLTIGPWPDLNLVMARERAMEIRTAIARGEDPATDATESRQELTFGKLVLIYMERHAKPHKRSAWQDENTIRRYVPAGWGNRKLSDISRSDIARLHAKVGDSNGRYVANRLLALLRVMFNLARTWELFKGDNPTLGIKQFKEEKRQRFLNADELQRINSALLQESDWRWQAYFPLALMLGTRRSELLSMRWCDVSLDQQTWRIPLTKQGTSNLLPLPSPALAILESLPSRGGLWVFPSHGKSGHLEEPKKAWKRICETAGVSNVRIHDLRHTLASLMVAQGFSLPMIGRALGHSQPSTTSRYAHMAMDPLRAALESTSALVMVNGK